MKSLLLKQELLNYVNYKTRCNKFNRLTHFEIFFFNLPLNLNSALFGQICIKGKYYSLVFSITLLNFGY